VPKSTTWPRWYVVQSKPREDGRALERLERQGLSCYRPTLRLEKLRQGRKVAIQESRLPGYLFVQLDDVNDNWYPIRSTRRVIEILRFNEHPLPIEDEIVEMIRERVASTELRVPYLEPGERVLIFDGCFAGVETIFVANDGDERVMLLMNVLHRDQSLSFPVDPRIAELFARSRDEDSEIEIQITHSPLSAQLRELRSGALDVGFTLCPSDDRDLRSMPLWKDSAALIMRPDHHLSTKPSIRQIDADTGALILLGERLSARTEPIDAWLLSSVQTARSIEYVASIELLLTMVAAGFGAGLISAAQAETNRRSDLVIRPLQIPGAIITTYLIQRHDDRSSVVARFTARAQKMD
jgi:transcriptional antiterminator RfaH